MTFGAYTDSVPRNISIKINNIEIERVEQCKYLGIIFDHNMKWDKQMLHIINKTKYCFYTFYQLKKIMSINQLLMVYHALVHSIITYGIIGWGGAYDNVNDKIQGLQTRMLKIIANKTKILTIKQTFIIQSLLLNYKTLRSKFENLQSKTRNKNLPLSCFNKEIYKKSHTYAAIKAFNILPICLKGLELSKKTAKNRFKNILKDNIEYLEEKFNFINNVKYAK